MAKQPRILAGQTALITGAARGIGRVTAETLVRRGVRVAIGDLDSQAAAAADELGPSTVALALDVTDRASFTAFLDGAEEQLGPVDILINNAGIMPIGPFLEEDDADRTADHRHQRPRRDPRHEAGAAADDRRAAPATSSTSPPRPASTASPAAPPTARARQR